MRFVSKVSGSDNIVSHVTVCSEGELGAWDRFVLSCGRGHPCQLSSWLSSFERFGFASKVFVIHDGRTEAIVGGIGVVEYHAGPFRVVTAPAGPIVDVGFEHTATALLSAAHEYARKHGAFLLQVQPLSSKNPGTFASLPGAVGDALPMAALGLPFRTANVPQKMYFIPFPAEPDQSSWERELLGRFSKNTRRDVRASQRSGLRLIRATTDDELRVAFDLIERNGRENGYATRTWSDLSAMVRSQVASGHAVVLIASKDNIPLGATYGIVAGRRYTYMMGATVRTSPDLLVGHFLHWEGMLLARALGLDGYDLSPGGNEGVRRFKNGFRPDEITFDHPVHVILSPLRFAFFMLLYNPARKHKKIMAAVLRKGAGLSKRLLRPQE